MKSKRARKFKQKDALRSLAEIATEAKKKGINSKAAMDMAAKAQRDERQRRKKKRR